MITEIPNALYFKIVDSIPNLLDLINFLIATRYFNQSNSTSICLEDLKVLAKLDLEKIKHKRKCRTRDSNKSNARRALNFVESDEENENENEGENEEQDTSNQVFFNNDTIFTRSPIQRRYFLPARKCVSLPNSPRMGSSHLSTQNKQTLTFDQKFYNLTANSNYERIFTHLILDPEFAKKFTFFEYLEAFSDTSLNKEFVIRQVLLYTILKFLKFDVAGLYNNAENGRDVPDFSRSQVNGFNFDFGQQSLSARNSPIAGNSHRYPNFNLSGIFSRMTLSPLSTATATSNSNRTTSPKKPPRTPSTMKLKTSWLKFISRFLKICTTNVSLIFFNELGMILPDFGKFYNYKIYRDLFKNYEILSNFACLGLLLLYNFNGYSSLSIKKISLNNFLKPDSYLRYNSSRNSSSASNNNNDQNQTQTHPDQPHSRTATPRRDSSQAIIERLKNYLPNDPNLIQILYNNRNKDDTFLNRNSLDFWKILSMSATILPGKDEKFNYFYCTLLDIKFCERYLKLRKKERKDWVNLADVMNVDQNHMIEEH